MDLNIFTYLNILSGPKATRAQRDHSKLGDQITLVGGCLLMVMCWLLCQ